MTDTETTQEELAKWMRKIVALLAKADDPATTPEESDSFRRKAEELMNRYRVEESMLAESAPLGSSALLPTWQEWPVCPVHRNEFSQHYKTIVSGVAKHIGARCVFRIKDLDVEGFHRTDWWVVLIVGFESDLRYGQLLWSMAKSAFGDRLQPKVDPELSDQVNAYRLRKAGMEGRRIALALWNDERVSARPKARKLYEAEAMERGEDPKALLGQGNSVKVYRDSYAEGFAVELWYRLQRSKIEADSGTGIVLASRATAVEDAFYERFPQYRPADIGAAHNEAGRDNCERCKKAKSGYCREHLWMKPKAGSNKAYNYGAYTAGRDAAATVDLGTHRTLT
jgi:hypothetical protein